MDELRNTISRYEQTHQLFIAYPPLHFLRMGYFYPNTVYTVLRMDRKLCHNHTVTFIQIDIGILQRKIFQTNRIVQHLQVRIPRIMILGKVSQRVFGLPAHSLRRKIGQGITARGQQNHDHRTTQGYAEPDLLSHTAFTFIWQFLQSNSRRKRLPSVDTR